MDSAKVARLLSDLMQTPRVEWFVSKGQRLPIGQSPPDVTGAPLLLACALLAEFFAYLKQLQSQPRAATWVRLELKGSSGGGRRTNPVEAPSPDPGTLVSRIRGLGQPG